MERVNGIGGLFFRAQDPDKLAAWYTKYFGIDPSPTSFSQAPWQQQAGPTLFAPFPQDTGYFGKPSQQWMINFRVDNLDHMVTQLEAGGIKVKVLPAAPNGSRFAHLHDPEGNPVELWQPTASPGAAAAAPPAKDIRHVVFHKPGVKWDHSKSFFEQEGLDSHVGHYKQLLADGKLFAGGPYLDDASGGMMIPAASMTEEQVRDFAEADPCVKSGLLHYEIRPWLVAMKAT